MTPIRIAALALGAAALVGIGVVVGDLLTDDPAPGDAPARTTVEVADGEAPDAQAPSLSIVSLGGETSTDGAADGAGDDADGTTLAAADFSQDAIDIDAFEAFDAAAEEGDDTTDLPDLPDGPSVDAVDEEVYAPYSGDEGTIEELGETGTSDPDGDGATTDGTSDTDDSGPDAAPPVERPDGVPPLDPDVYELDVDLPPVLGFDDPCAVRSPVGCPFGIPAVVLGSDPTVPLRLGSVGVFGTETFHRNACTSLRSRETADDDAPEQVVLALTTNQEAELEVNFAGGESLVVGPEPADVALSQFVAELRDDGRTPSEGPGSVITCVTVPSTSLDEGLVRGKALATVGDQRDTLGFELRLAGSGRSRPISFSSARLPAPTDSAPFELAIPQRDPAEELAVVGFIPLDGRRVGRTDCAAFAPMLDEVRAMTFRGRDSDDGAPALPVGLSLRADDGTRVSPNGTFPAAAGVPDAYNATFRGYLPMRATYRLCAWWFQLEEADGGHRVDGAPSDTAMVEVEVGLGLSAGVYVTGITTPEPRPPGHYNLYLVKPGALAVCLPRRRPDAFPIGASTSLGSSGAEIASDDSIPAGRHDFGPGQAQEVVPICVPSALAPIAFPMVKAGARPYRLGSAPILIEPDPLPVIPDGPGIPARSVTYPVVAPDGAVLDVTVVPGTSTGRSRWFSLGAEEPQPPATVQSTLELVGEPSFTGGEEAGSAVLTVRFNENVDVRARLIDPGSGDPADVCTAGAAVTEAVTPNGPDHEVRFEGLCAGVAYAVMIDATDADGTTTTFDGGSYRVPPDVGVFDIDVDVVSVPDGGAVLSVADVQFLRVPGVVSLSTRVRADDLLGECLGVGDVDDDAAVLTSFGEQARVRVRIEGAAGCDGGPALRIDNTLELSAADLTAGPLVFDMTHPAGLTLRVTITPRAVT